VLIDIEIAHQARLLFCSCRHRPRWCREDRLGRHPGSRGV